MRTGTHRTIDCTALTERESHVAALLLLGMNRREISQSLRISVGTVQQYVIRLFDKTGTHSRIECVNALMGLRGKRNA